MTAKNIAQVIHATNFHWVGDGFPVTTLFSYNDAQTQLSPFLLLDYAGPADFEPSNLQRGVGMHPHRGFETVTIVYDGEVEHRDNKGNSGKIGPGGVQWMTAAQGILHEEKHSQAFTKAGGKLEMIQLWVNLPAKHKMDTPRYQEILASKIPVVTLGEGAGQIRIIAGEYANQKGSALTFTPINLWDVKLTSGANVELTLPENTNTLVLVLKGEVRVNNEQRLSSKELVVFERQGDTINLSAEENSVLLVLNGEPIDEPVIGHGPFVMNTQSEINQAITDFQSGRF